MLPNEGYLTTDAGVRLFFQTIGQAGPPIVIPNGFYLIGDFSRLAAKRTLIVYDVRNRGRSDPIADASLLAGGIENDVADLEAVRRHFAIDRLDVIGHSYIGMMVTMYAMKHPDRVNRVVSIGPMQPYAGKEYPPVLTAADSVLGEVLAKLGQMQKETQPTDPEERCRKFWSILRTIYVTNPDDAWRVNWERCDLPNERNALKYFNESILPSIRRLAFTAKDLAGASSPILIVHGRRDRSAPYGGGREWALILANARLVSVPDGGHAPWIEAPDSVFQSISTFLDGGWPAGAEQVEAL
jgi:proline iminopeptidase